MKVSAKRKIKKDYGLKFFKDISVIVYDGLLNRYWVLSDEVHARFQITTKVIMLKKYPVKIEKPEGIG